MRLSRLTAALIAPAVASYAAVYAHASGPTIFLPLGDLPGGTFHSIATAVSSDGSTVVGYGRTSTGEDTYEAFRWTASEGLVGLSGLGSPPDSRARSVSADGSLVVLSGGDPWPVLWTESGGLVEVPDTTGTLLAADPLDISSDGTTIVGVARSTAEPANQAFRWTEATGFEPLGWLPSTTHDSFMTGASADGSVLAGFSFHHGFDVEPMIWTEASGLDSLGDVPGGDPYALAWGISEDGLTVVGDAHIGGASEPWLWREDAGFIRPDPLHGAGDSGWFEAVSADGSVAVGAPAILWDAEHGIRRLADMLTDAGIDISGWLLQAATDVSADGRTIVGYGVNPEGNIEAWLVRLPDPTVGVSPADARPALTVTPLGPNPSRGGRAFRLTLPGATYVDARVFSVTGRYVCTVVESRMAAGAHVVTWDGRRTDGHRVASGVYFLHVQARDQTVVRKIVTLE